MLTNEILSSIDNIDDCVMEAELNVLTAMINEYDKAIMIMENYNGNDYSSFDIFMEADELYQEGKIGRALDKIDSKLQKKDGESIIKRILLALPRLIMKLINYIRDKFNERRLNKCAEDISDIIDGLDDLFDDNGGPVQEGFFSSKIKSNKTNQSNNRTTNNNRPKTKSSNDQTDKIVELSNDLKNIDLNDKQAVKKLVIKLITSMSTTRAEMEETMSMVKKGIQIIKDINKDGNIITRDLDKITNGEKEALDDLCKFCDNNFHRLVEWAGKSMNREDSAKKMIKMYENPDKEDLKTLLKEGLYFLSGLGEFVVRSKVDPMFKLEKTNEMIKGFDVVINKLNEIEFDEKTKDTKSKCVKMLNMTAKLLVTTQKQLQGVSNGIDKITSEVNKIKSLFLKL